MLVTVGRWLVMLECERQSDQDGLRGGEAEALGGRESRWEGWIGCKQELPRREMFLYIKCMTLRTATLSELRLMCSLKSFSFLTRLCLHRHL